MATEDKIESVYEIKTESVSETKIESGTQKVTEAISEKRTAVISPAQDTSDSRERSDLLDPLTAVRLVWAITDGFPKSRLLKKKEEADLKEPDTPPSNLLHYSNINADEANIILKTIITESEKNIQEKEYIKKSVIAMRAALRNLGTLYSGRELNFRENDDLRQAYIASITDSITLSNDFKKWSEGLPAALLSGLAGLGVSYFFKEFIGLPFGAADYLLFILLFAIFGYIIAWMIMKYGYSQKFKGLMQQELERNIYYEQYLYRVHGQLQNLFAELTTIHEEVFHKPYSPHAESEGKTAITGMITALCPTACQNIMYCSRERGTNKDHWAWCETGVGESCLTLKVPPEKPEDGKQWKPACEHWKPEHPAKSLIIPSILIAIGIILGILIFISAAPGPGATLEKTSSVQDLLVNQSLNISVALTNGEKYVIRDIQIKDEVPDGFNLTSGSVTQTGETLEAGRTIVMNYSLMAVKPGTYDFAPAIAYYAVNESLQRVSSKSLNVTVNEGNTTSS